MGTTKRFGQGSVGTQELVLLKRLLHAKSDHSWWLAWTMGVHSALMTTCLSHQARGKITSGQMLQTGQVVERMPIAIGLFRSSFLFCVLSMGLPLWSLRKWHSEDRALAGCCRWSWRCATLIGLVQSCASLPVFGQAKAVFSTT